MKIARTLLIGVLASLCATGAKAQSPPPAVGANPDITGSVPSAQLSVKSGDFFSYAMSTADMDTLRSTDQSISQFRDLTQTMRADVIESSTVAGAYLRKTGDNPPPPATNPTGYTWAFDGVAVTVAADKICRDTWYATDQRGRDNSDNEAGPYTVSVLVRK